MATLLGTSGNDVIDGTTGDDEMNGLQGNDLLDGRAGSDRLGGDDGNDTLYGGPGTDFLGFLDEGDDVMYGGSSRDIFDAFEVVGADDWMDGGAGDDLFNYVWGLPGFPGGNTVPIGNDTIIGGPGTDLVRFSNPVPPASPSGSTTGTAAVFVDLENGVWNTAGASGTILGVEAIMGSWGADTILGSRGAESLSGSLGNDFIDGRGGKDRLEGGLGIDTLNGGAGGDEFVFNAILRGPFPPFPIVEALPDVIEDFTPGRDELLFDGSVYDALGAEGKWRAGDERFHAAAGVTSAQDADDRLIYNTTTGDLYYDADGSGSDAALLVAMLEGAPALSASDITVFV